MNWQPIETAPKCKPIGPAIEILFYHKDYGPIIGFCVNQDSEGISDTWHTQDGRIIDKHPTHWQHLPDSPK